MATLQDLESLGYLVTVAHGDAESEEAALQTARDDATPDAIAAQAGEVTSMTIAQLDAEGKLPETPEERLELASKIAAAALEGLTERATGRIAFHEKALEIAREMPTAYRVVQVAENEHGDEVEILALYLSVNDDGTGAEAADQDAIDSLAAADAYAERAYEIGHGSAYALAGEIRAHGVAIDRRMLGEDVWEAEGRTFTAAELEGLRDEAAARPATPLAPLPEKVADAAAAAVGAVLPVVAPGATAEQREQAKSLARQAALDATE